MFLFSRKIELNNTCFNISQDQDPRLFVIAIYVKKDRHNLVAKDESEMREWLNVLDTHHRLGIGKPPEREPSPTSDYGKFSKNVQI